MRVLRGIGAGLAVLALSVIAWVLSSVTGLSRPIGMLVVLAVFAAVALPRARRHKL